jgi:hypothetical protein
MATLKITDFFSLCVIDLSKLIGINLKEFLELRELPEYYFIISPVDLPIEYLLDKIPANYKVYAVGKKYYIASQISSKEYYIPEAKYILANKIAHTHPILLSILYTKVLYVNLDEYNDKELIKAYAILDKIAKRQFQIDIICIQSQKIRRLKLNNWKYIKPRFEYSANEVANYHILINKLNDPNRFDNLLAEGNICQCGNYGVTLYIPNWLMERLYINSSTQNNKPYD